MKSTALLVSTNAPMVVRALRERAQTRFWEFFVNNVRNPHTRRAYGRAIGEFLTFRTREHALAHAFALAQREDLLARQRLNRGETRRIKFSHRLGSMRPVRCRPLAASCAASAIALRNFFFALVVMFHLDEFTLLDCRLLAQ
ncbi:hypothetical protein [Methylocystis silviterrae]|uniref:hypothetical protein n=1 Tax=Methylocystis silviterrae TaxID=2743612 RepID=UPI003C772B44